MPQAIIYVTGLLNQTGQKVLIKGDLIYTFDLFYIIP